MDYYLCANRLVHTASVAEIDAAILRHHPTPVMDHVWSFHSEENFQTLLGELKTRLERDFAFLLLSVSDGQILKSAGNHPVFSPSHDAPRSGSAEEVDLLLRSSSGVLAMIESRLVDLRS
jgi:hypothetical protein